MSKGSLRSRVASAALFAAALAAAPGRSSAGTYTFTASGSAGWQSSNFNPHGLPGTQDEAVFPSTQSGGSYDPLYVQMFVNNNVGRVSVPTHGVFSMSGNPGVMLTLNSGINDYVGQSGTPAYHSINIPYLDVNGTVNVGDNANLTITSSLSGSFQKSGNGTLWLTNAANTFQHLDVWGGTVAVTADALPFTSWSEPIFLHSGTTLRVAQSTHVSRPLRGPFDGDAFDAPVTLSVDAGQYADFATSYWGFVSLNIAGGGTAHLPGVEFTPLQGHPRNFNLNITGGSNLVLDNCLGSPTIWLNNGTLTAGASFYDTGNIQLNSISLPNVVNTNGNTIDVEHVTANVFAPTLTKIGAGTLKAIDLSGVGTVNLNGGALAAKLGNTKALNMAAGTEWDVNDDNTTGAAIHLAGQSTIRINAGITTLNGGPISGSGLLDKFGGGTLKLQNQTASSFSGVVRVVEGRLELASNGLPNVSALSINHGATAALLAPDQLNPYLTPDVYGTLELNTPTLGTPPIFSNYGFALYDGAALLAKQSIDTGSTRAVLVSGNTTIDVDAGNVLTVSGQINGSGSVRKISGGTLLLNQVNAYTGDTTVSGGALVVGPGASLGCGALNVNGSGAKTIFATGNTAAQRVTSLNIGPSNTVDLNDNDMIIGSTTPTNAVVGYVASARNGGNWNGAGLTSGSARLAASHSTTLGVLRGSEFHILRGPNATFDGAPVADTDTLVKYTYYGDSNFSGAVDFDDYVRTDIGFNTHLSGWANGDFNYSGAVDFDDYVLIDVAFNTQAGTLGRAVAYLNGEDRSESGRAAAGVDKVTEHFGQFGVPYANAFLAAVPEPSSIVAVGALAVAMAGRHRRVR